MNAGLPANLLASEKLEGSLLTLQVKSIRMEAEGIHSFELAYPDGRQLPAVEAGAHVDVHLPGGLVRSYSLAGNPLDKSRWVLGVLKEANGRGGSKAMHERVAVGNSIIVGMPRNAFRLVANGAEHTVLLAGGIGITPLKAMAYVLAEENRSFELHYCARTMRNAAFVTELNEIVPKGCLYFHFDNGDPAQGLDIHGLLKHQKSGAHLYYCGPGGFMKACADASKHWMQGTVHSEHFKTPEPTSPSDVSGGSFEVRLARSGTIVEVLSDQTIVRAIELAGHRIPTSCLSGLCGACKVSYLEGEVDHRDYILSEEERKSCLTTCVSRAKSSILVLDI